MDPADRYLLRDLDREWRALLATGEPDDWLARRRETVAELADLGSVAELVSAVQTGMLERSTEIVWALLGLVAGDRFAVRVVLQCVIPGLYRDVAMIRHWARGAGADLRPADADGILLPAAIEAIMSAAGTRRNWPLKSILRRTRRLIERELSDEEEWRRHVRVESNPSTAAPIDETSPGAVLAELLSEATAQGVVSQRDAELVFLVGVAGYGAEELQGHFGASYACLRQRQHRAACRLAELRAAG